MTSKEKGDQAVGQAIAHYTTQLEEVLLPLGDRKPYDFAIDRNGKLLKVQSKYTSNQTKYGIFQAQLRVSGGNQSFNTVKRYSEGDFDLLFAYTSSGDKYEIPYEVIKNNCNSICLGDKYKKYKI